MLSKIIESVKEKLQVILVQFVPPRRRKGVDNSRNNIKFGHVCI